MAESAPGNRLAQILARKRKENARRERFAHMYRAPLHENAALRISDAVARLRRRKGDPPHIIAELKFRSPSAGVFRPRKAGDVVAIAKAYARGGASAVSVLADGPGFGGSPLNVRRVATSIEAPVLFKEFVLGETQLDLAASMGARYVLLIVRALEVSLLQELVDACAARGLAPVVEAASPDELDVAIDTGAAIVGFNARDLTTFDVDPGAAARAVDRIPAERVAIYMSGIRTQSDFARVAAGRADAALIGEGLMRQGDPETTLKTWRGALDTP
ncbi:MAG: indole-3-glycerol-phosphate synthase [Polyangiales bacterium]